MTVKVTPLGSTVGAEVSNVRLADLDDGVWKEIEDAFNAHAVLVFHDQYLSLGDQIAFALRFGPFARYNNAGGKKAPGREVRLGDPIITLVGNVDKRGNHITDPNDPLIRGGGGNEGWHSDSSFQRLGAKTSMLSGIEVTSEGGTTEFADMRAAYDVLPEKTTEYLATLRGWHSIQYSRTMLGANDEQLPEDPTASPGAEHSLVRHHPQTGRPSLVLGVHVCQIFGMDTDKSQTMVRELMDEAIQAPRIYQHQWQAGDIVLWDNRCVLHRARPYPLDQRRQLQHVRIIGDVEF